MKLSKMRAKARAVFKRGKRVLHRDDRGEYWPAPLVGEVTVPVAVIRGRVFTKPQAAEQRE